MNVDAEVFLIHAGLDLARTARRLIRGNPFEETAEGAKLLSELETEETALLTRLEVLTREPK